MKSNYINVLRGITIFLMLWGHCIQVCIPTGLDFFENPLFKIIYSFHMPLFMLISGYLFYYSFEKRNMKDLLVHRCGSLLKTIVFFGIFSYFMTTGLFSVIKGDFSALFNGGWLPSLAGLWFIWSVLSASLVVGFICKKVKRIWLQVLLLAVGSVVVLLFQNGINNLFMYPFYVIGFYFAKYKNKISSKMMLIKYASLVIFPILLVFFEKRHYIYTTGLIGSRSYSLLQYVEIDLFRWGIGLVGSVFVAVLVESIYNFVIIKKPQFILFKATSYLGEKSLQIYALSVIFLSSYLAICYPKIIKLLPQVNTFFTNHMWIYNFGFTLLLAVAYSIGISLIIKLLEKSKISKILFGR